MRPVYLLRTGLAGALLTCLLVSLAGCQPLYLPPAPQAQHVPPVAELGDASAVRLEGGTLVLHMVLAEVPEPGWLAVQWFAPDGIEASSDSVWVTPADVGQGRTMMLPPRVTLTTGEWRAVASLRGRVLRQFRVEVPAGAVAP